MEINAANADELTAAIRAANAKHDEAHVINLTGTDEQYVVFRSSDDLFGPTAFPIVTADITINGNNRIISRAASAPAFRLFAINGRNEYNAARLVLNQLTLCYSDSGHMGGGAIVNDGLLIVNECVLQDNRGAHGGAIYAGDGAFTSVMNSVFIHNTGTEQGGAIFGAFTCQLQVKTSVFYENYSKDGDNAIYESSPDTAQLDACVSWDGITLKTFRSGVNGVQESEKLEIPAVLELLKQTLGNANHIADLRKTMPTNEFDAWMPSATWWRDLTQLSTANSILQQAESENRIPKAEIDRLIFSRQFERVHELGVTAHIRKQAIEQTAQLSARIFPSIEYQLAITPGVDFLAAFLRLIGIENGIQAYHLAGAIANHQSQETILAFFERQDLRTLNRDQVYFLLALAQELVIRGMDGRNAAPIQQFVDAVKRDATRQYGLAKLPLYLTDIESEIGEYIEIDGGISSPRPRGEDKDIYPPSRLNSANLPVFVQTTTRDSSREMQAAFSELTQWVEARSFQYETALSSDIITPDLLLALPLDCLRGAARMGLRWATPKLAYNLLFWACNAGRAYAGGGTGAANGRRTAWESMAALMGVSEGKSVEELGEIAQQCQWYYFWADSEWFFDTIDRIGVVVLRPDGQTLAVIAATASD